VAVHVTPCNCTANYLGDSKIVREGQSKDLKHDIIFPPTLFNIYIKKIVYDVCTIYDFVNMYN